MDMDNFTGIITGYDGISVDCFKKVDCLAFFLSHCHTDHMIGLGDDLFFDRLRLSNGRVKLYCSKATKHLLHWDNNYRHSRLEPHLCALELNKRTRITLHYDDIDGNDDDRSDGQDADDNDDKSSDGEDADDHDDGTNSDISELEKTFFVTLLPAEHCPGSVMFLFEGNSGRVLFTGDFRLTLSQLKAMTPLHTEQGTVKKIDKLYLDSTFCLPQCLTFPTKEESCNEVFRILKKRMRKLKDDGVSPNEWAFHINGRAQFGYEYIFEQLVKRFKMKIHVCKSKYYKYRTIPELRYAVTMDSTDTKMHACFYKSDNGCNYEYGRNEVLPCEAGLKSQRQRVLFVKLSTIWFVENYDKIGNAISYEESPFSQRVLYSMHSSFSEILDLVRYLNPDVIEPLVIPGDSSREKILQRLKCRDVDELRMFLEADRAEERRIRLESWAQFFPNGLPTASEEEEGASDPDDSNEEDERNAATTKNEEKVEKLIVQRRHHHHSSSNSDNVLSAPEERCRKYPRPVVDSPKRSKLTKKKILEPTKKSTSSSRKRSNDSSDEKTSRRLKLTSPKKAGKMRATVRGKKKENKFRWAETPPESEAEADDDDDEAEAERPVYAKYKR